MAERTRDELAEWLKDFIENPLDGNIQKDAVQNFRLILARLRSTPKGESVDVWIEPRELHDLHNDNIAMAIIEAREDEVSNGHLGAVLIVQCREAP